MKKIVFCVMAMAFAYTEGMAQVGTRTDSLNNYNNRLDRNRNNANDPLMNRQQNTINNSTTISPNATTPVTPGSSINQNRNGLQNTTTPGGVNNNGTLNNGTNTSPMNTSPMNTSPMNTSPMNNGTNGTMNRIGR